MHALLILQHIIIMLLQLILIAILDWTISYYPNRRRRRLISYDEILHIVIGVHTEVWALDMRRLLLGLLVLEVRYVCCRDLILLVEVVIAQNLLRLVFCWGIEVTSRWSGLVAWGCWDYMLGCEVRFFLRCLEFVFVLFAEIILLNELDKRIMYSRGDLLFETVKSNEVLYESAKIVSFSNNNVASTVRSNDDW